ncbi:hypothetical protein BV898_03674 [Hypsibius exemplaris]|uniref:Uncharacterized protein n=1 Tax=Hypsibius exemplaris TaxID=2072580 RepID=A0A1W0X585_HYPEX|nr:hypothetical protein BV898_03674 [Hypsibius exemplaris]
MASEPSDQGTEEGQTFDRIDCAFRSVLRDVRQLQSNADYVEATLTGNGSRHGNRPEKDADFSFLKDQIAFLAKRILILHNSHEDTQAQLDTLVKFQILASTSGDTFTVPPQTAETQTDRHGAETQIDQHGAETQTERHGAETQIDQHGSKTQTERHDSETQTDRHGSGTQTDQHDSETQTDRHDSEDSPDSGCLTNSSSSSSSSGTPSSDYLSRHDLDDVGPNGETSFSETTTLTPPAAADAPSVVFSVLRSLICEDVAFTHQLKVICQNLKTVPSRRSKQLEDLFCRHTLFLQLLTSLRAQCRHGVQRMGGLEEVWVHLCRFWSKQECIAAYIEFLVIDWPIIPATQKRIQEPIAEALRNHFSFLRAYLKGVKDCLSLSDVHLDQVLSILDFIHSRGSELLRSPTPRIVPGENSFDVVDLDPQLFVVSFVEGTSRIVGFYQTTHEGPGTMEVAVQTESPRVSYFQEVLHQRYLNDVQPASTDEGFTDVFCHRKPSWKRNLLNALKQAAYRSPNHLKKSFSIV